MSRNYYEILGLRQSANDASIRRAIDAAKERINADAKLSSSVRATRLAQLQTAADVLCSPEKRDAYDTALHDKSDASARGLLSPRTLGIALAIVVLGGGIYWQYDRNQTSQRLEQERIAAEKAQVRRIEELEQRRIADAKRLVEELRAQRDADEKQHQDVNELRSAESQKKQYVADDRPGITPPVVGNYEDQRQISAEARQRAMEERNQRSEDEANLRRAKAEVDRQKRYLEQLEHDDQYARARREAASRPSR